MLLLKCFVDFFFAFTDGQLPDPSELVGYFIDAAAWGMASARGYMAFMGAVALIVYMFKN